MSDSAPHFLVICVGTAGDIHPFLSIAQSLQALGRRVTVITNGYHATRLVDMGLTIVGMGSDEDFLRVIRQPELWDEKKGFATLLARYGEQLQQLETAIRAVVDAAPTIAIVHPIVVPGAAIAREQGLIGSIVSCYLAPSTLRTFHNPMRLGSTRIPDWFPMRWRRGMWRYVERKFIDPLGLGQLNAHRRALQLPPVGTSFLGHLESATDLTVALFPSWFGPTMPDWPQPLLTSDFPLFDAAASDRFSPELETFLAAGDAPLVFTPGTGHLHAKTFFDSALEASTNLGRRAIFLTRERAQIPASLPASVLWQPYVPLAALLPKAAALIHHGGIGTTAEALRAGVPQLVTPFGWDQHDNGARLKALGVGAVIRARRLRPRGLERELRTLLESDAVRAHCARLAVHFKVPLDAKALCGEIERRLDSRDRRPV